MSCTGTAFKTHFWRKEIGKARRDGKMRKKTWAGTGWH